MTIKLATRVLAGALFASAAVASQAAETPKFDVGVSLISALDSTKRATHNSGGFNFQGGVEFAVQENLGFRFSLGWNSFSGTETAGVMRGTEQAPATPIATSGKFALRSYQGSGDFLFATGVTNLRWVFGLSVNRYTYSLVVTPGFESPMRYKDKTGYHDAFAPTTPYAQVPGTKVGARLGLEYRIIPNLSASLLLQQTELGSALSNAHQINVNPSWLELGVKYHF